MTRHSWTGALVVSFRVAHRRCARGISPFGPARRADGEIPRRFAPRNDKLIPVLRRVGLNGEIPRRFASRNDKPIPALRPLTCLLCLALASAAQAQSPSLFAKASQPQNLALSLRLLIGMALLSLAPALLVMLTGFTRIIIVLSFLRSALGTQQTPPNSVLIGLALFLTAFVMHPTWERINKEAVQPYMAGKLPYERALARGEVPLRQFMFTQTREKDLGLFVRLSNTPRPKAQADIPTYALIPAFVISELKSAFQIGFVIYLPFLVIDMVVASALMSMGMMMLPPTMVSLPFKILLFVMIDGWHLIAKSVVLSFG